VAFVDHRQALTASSTFITMTVDNHREITALGAPAAFPRSLMLDMKSNLRMREMRTTSIVTAGVGLQTI
jgi:hypothetical protein